MDARVKQPGREADHVPLSGAEVNNAQSGTSATVWCLICTRKAVTPLKQLSSLVSRTSGLMFIGPCIILIVE